MSPHPPISPRLPYIGPYGAHPGDDHLTPDELKTLIFLNTMLTPETLNAQTALLQQLNPDLSAADARAAVLAMGDTPILDAEGLAEVALPDGRTLKVIISD